MNPKTAIALSSLTLFFLLYGIIWQHPTYSQPLSSTVMLSSSQDSSLERQLVKANTQFGFKLFSSIVQQDPQQNVFVSPSSVAIALSMLYNGASGTTQRDMATALQLSGMSLNEINQANQSLSETLQNADPEVQLAIANSLWGREGVSFNEQFLKNNQEFYQAKISSLNFARPESVKTINSWVSENTKGKIDKIIDRLTSQAILILINAIYFKGNWTNKFDKNLTTIKPFNLINGNRKELPMMSQSGSFKYAENELFQAVSIPYSKGRLSMYIFLPNQNINFPNFLQEINQENWQRWLSKFSKRQGLLEIPRFKLEYEIQLEDALKALGMGSIFNGSQADFSAMTSLKVRVNEVKHKTFVEVNEEGTEAAAVTSIGVRSTSVGPRDEPFKMVVDRPFFGVIRDNQTGAILFMGAIFEPK